MPHSPGGIAGWEVTVHEVARDLSHPTAPARPGLVPSTSPTRPRPRRTKVQPRNRRESRGWRVARASFLPPGPQAGLLPCSSRVQGRTRPQSEIWLRLDGRGAPLSPKAPSSLPDCNLLSSVLISG